MNKFISVSNIFFIVVLISLGGLVHNTGASLACPDWPLCFGKVMPKMEGGVLVEHSHRMLGAFVGLLTLLIAGLNYRLYRKAATDIKNGKSKLKFGLLVRNSFIAVFLVIIQGVLGGLTVLYKLPTIVSTAHLGLAMFFLLWNVMLFYQAYQVECPGDRSEKIKGIKLSSFLSKFWIIAFGLLFVQILWGAFIRHLGIGSLCGLGWENSLQCFDLIAFQYHWIPTSLPAQLHVVHRYMAVILGAILLVLPILTMKYLKGITSSTTNWKLIAIMAVTVVQILLGIWAVGSHLEAWITTFHLTGASVLLMLVFSFIYKSHSEYVPSYASLKQYCIDLLVMTKPRLSSLVIFTATLGGVLAPGVIDWSNFAVVILSIIGLVAGACVINCYMEKDVDKLMARTSQRPLPSGRLSDMAALSWGGGLVILSIVCLFVFSNTITALLGITASLFYVALYTPLKKITPLSVFIGAIPGALPPLMGQTAVTGEISTIGLILFALLFAWQVPHFLSISLHYAKEYEAAGLKIYPTTKGIAYTHRNIFYYTLLLFFISLLPVFYTGVEFSLDREAVKYLLLTVLLGGLYLLLALMGLSPKNLVKATSKWSRYYFWGSITYLPLQLSLMVLLL